MRKIRVMVREVEVLQALSADFLIRSIEKMLTVLFSQMRRSSFDAGGHSVDLSVETAWRGVWL